MKTIGIIGGLGPESTLEYYKGIINGYRNIKGEEHYPQIYINSINMTEMLNYVKNNEYEKLTNMLVMNIIKLKNIGADFVAIASNTPHVVIDKIIKKVPISIVSIVEETCKYAQIKKLKKVLLTGTLFTMNSEFYQKQFEEYNINCIVPDDIEKEIIQNIIFPELEDGIINKMSKRKFVEICNNKIRTESIDGIVLGCTELPLLIKENDFEICILNTMEIHINSIIKKMT
jgi:aspartate racemase